MKLEIYGAGQAGEAARRWIPADVDILCMIDSDPARHGQQSGNLTILSPDDALAKKPDTVMIAVLNQDAAVEIRNTLIDKGFTGRILDIIDFRSLQDIRLAALRMAADQIRERNVPGAVAELGVYRGDFAKEINREFPDRELYLFDTFTGFDETDMTEESAVTGCRRFRDFSDTGTELVRDGLPFPENAVFVPGHFPESTASMVSEPAEYALISLDPDLYMPARNGLEYFWPRLAEGGIILIHDYTSIQFPGVQKAVDEYCRQHGLYVVPLSDLHGTAVLIKQGGQHD